MMRYDLAFERKIAFDNGLAGISVDTELKLADASIVVPAKIDTGASFCIFSREVGEVLGLVVEEGFQKMFRTTTGTFKAFGHGVTLIVDEFEFDSQVFFSEMPGFQPNVLGRQGWLDRVNLAIFDSRGELFLSRVTDS